MVSYIYSLIFAPLFVFQSWRSRVKQQRVDRLKALKENEEARMRVGNIASLVYELRKDYEEFVRPITNLNQWLNYRIVEEVPTLRCPENSAYCDASVYYWNRELEIRNLVDGTWSFDDDSDLYWIVNDYLVEFDRWKLQDNNFNSDGIIPDHIFADLAGVRSKISTSLIKLINYLEECGVHAN